MPDDELALAQKARQLRRNSFGYSVDTCTTVIGFGASAIGHLCDGYAQNELTQFCIAGTSDQAALPRRRAILSPAKIGSQSSSGANGTISQQLLVFDWTQ
ncbi:hypothetical protein CUJ84_pRLN3000254 (plasmid) [Rhizobium leguminosarum]|uniref:Uncharacterized protein n=1 Tax=Rhizobium leguminosarum TaxID=384 RepID=A0A2K9ZH60_RHILE|nr:hypothetical protein CUJ84_pRLN3000254 [Rhizobium leguminosarum]